MQAEQKIKELVEGEKTRRYFGIRYLGFHYYLIAKWNFPGGKAQRSLKMPKAQVICIEPLHSLI